MRSTSGKLVAAAIGLGLTLGWYGPASAQSWRTVTSARQLWDQEPLDVEITYGVGELTIGQAEESMMYEMELRYDSETMEPRINFDDDSNQLRLGIESIRRDDDRRRRNDRERSTARIELSPSVLMDLRLEFGAGEAEIDLGGMSLRNVSVATGASDTEIEFGSPNRIQAETLKIQAGAADLDVIGIGNLRANRVEFEGGVGATTLDFSGASGTINASVEMGVGSVTLRLPRTHGIQLNRSSFLTSFDANGLRAEGNSYYSSNWTSAAQKIVLDVSAALGSIDIEWVE